MPPKTNTLSTLSPKNTIVQTKVARSCQLTASDLTCGPSNDPWHQTYENLESNNTMNSMKVFPVFLIASNPKICFDFFPGMLSHPSIKPMKVQQSTTTMVKNHLKAMGFGIHWSFTQLYITQTGSCFWTCLNKCKP